MPNDNAEVEKLSTKNPDMAKPLLRLMAITAILELSSLAIGIAFFSIVFGFIIGFRCLVLYWEPAFRLFSRLLDFQAKQFIRIKITWWRAIIILVNILFVLLCLYFGITTLLSKGFLGQNIIYGIITNSR